MTRKEGRRVNRKLISKLNANLLWVDFLLCFLKPEPLFLVYVSVVFSPLLCGSSVGRRFQARQAMETVR
jgi:hypothetical protein